MHPFRFIAKRKELWLDIASKHEEATQINKETQERSFRLKHGAHAVSCEIPVEWENFMGTTARWRHIEKMDKYATACEFTTESDFEMPCHFHYRKETLILSLGTIHVWTAFNGDLGEAYHAGDQVTFPVGSSHIVKFYGKCACAILWTPPFLSGQWEAEMIAEEKTHKPEELFEIQKVG
jgi:quercetin dioxygenase-like cupin family protein